jgi:hypothetical protein
MKRRYRTGFSLAPIRGPAASLEDSYPPLPLPIFAKTEMRNIRAALARVAKSQQGAKILVNSPYGERTLSINLIFLTVGFF